MEIWCLWNQPDDLGFVTQKQPLEAIRRWVHSGYKRMSMVGSNIQIKNAKLVLRSPNCANTISPTPLHHHLSELFIQGRMVPCLHVVYTKVRPYYLNIAAEIKTHQTGQCFFPVFYHPILVCSTTLQPQFLAGRPASLAVTTVPHSESLQSPFLPHSETLFELLKVVLKRY